ncbi:MAG: glycosyltransferase [Candidatus Eremiobacteraeota bacterium]|nr:glycosyltransferase [Candidatus Eremiobacteraeota bacterium]
MEMRLPLISIIITTYNYAHTVGTAIRSALAQDYPNLEVLVVDNASTDATPALVKTFARDPRLKYVRNPENIGMIPNHNEGLRHARGEYVAFLSADDFLMQHFVSRSYAFLQAHPEIDVLYGATYFVDKNERFFGIRQMAGQPLCAYEGGRNEFAALFTDGCYMCFPTMLMRRDLYERYGMLDEAIKAADYEIVLRWAEAGVRFAYDPEPVAAVRIHDSQQSSFANYLADGGDIKEFLYFAKKFIRPETEERLAGYESRVAGHARTRQAMNQNAGYADADVAAQVDALVARVEEIRQRNIARPRTPRPTIVVLAGNIVPLLAETLESLVAQRHRDWEALVVQNPATSFAPLARYMDPQGRIRAVELIGGVDEPLRLNTALKIASGNVYAFAHAGTVWPADHLEKLLEAFEAPNAEVVVSRNRVAIDQGAGECTVRMRLHNVDDAAVWANLEPLLGAAPAIPLDALAFSQRAYDRVGAFNESIPVFAGWEILLRLCTLYPIVRLESTVELREILGFADGHVLTAAMPSVARAIFSAYPSHDPTVAQRRQTYLRGLEAALAAGPQNPTGAEQLAALHAIVTGANVIAAPVQV